jgi:hypothetical protein
MQCSMKGGFGRLDVLFACFVWLLAGVCPSALSPGGGNGTHVKSRSVVNGHLRYATPVCNQTSFLQVQNADELLISCGVDVCKLLSSV